MILFFYLLRYIQSLSEHTSKKLQIVPSVIFIDGNSILVIASCFYDHLDLHLLEGAVLNQSKEERCQTVMDVMSIAEKSNFSAFFVPLEQVFSSTPNIYDFHGPFGDLERLISGIVCQTS